MKPKIAILQTDGINCDEELFYSFASVGGKSEMVHVNSLISDEDDLSNYQILALPGGFSYGDDILSGKILANELRHQLFEEIQQFVQQKKLVIGVCNGFQVLVRMGILPWRMGPAEDVSLIDNDSGTFECRWTKLKVAESPCVFTKGLEEEVFEMPVAHGGGKVAVKDKTVGKRLVKNKHIAFQYVDESHNATMKFPANPNGLFKAAAALTDATGHILGIMPHPERSILRHQNPHWRTKDIKTTQVIFKNAIDYFK